MGTAREKTKSASRRSNEQDEVAVEEVKECQGEKRQRVPLHDHAGANLGRTIHWAAVACLPEHLQQISNNFCNTLRLIIAFINHSACLPALHLHIQMLAEN